MPEDKEFEISDEDVSGKKEEEFLIEGKIAETSNFDELYSLLKQEGKIVGFKRRYTAGYLIGAIDDFRSAFKKFMETATRRELTKENIENLLKIHSELLTQIHKITRKEDLRLNVLEFALREARESDK